eukprot:3669467-Alexandrium_andersonii.AAC.1
MEGSPWAPVRRLARGSQPSAVRFSGGQENRAEEDFPSAEIYARHLASVQWAAQPPLIAGGAAISRAFQQRRE